MHLDDISVEAALNFSAAAPRYTLEIFSLKFSENIQNLR